jgi:hypothetical protein
MGQVLLAQVLMITLLLLEPLIKRKLFLKVMVKYLVINQQLLALTMLTKMLN